MSSPDVSSADPLTADDRPASRAGANPRRRSFLPRFGLRTALVFALLFCLLFGWVGRNLYRMRQEDAAIEALLRAGATVYRYVPPRSELNAFRESVVFEEERTTVDLLSRAIGWSGRTRIDSIVLYGEEVGDPKFAAALANLWLFPEIRYVELHGPAFDDAAIAPLSGLKNLDSLHLARTRATGDGLAALAPTVPLREIVLYDDDPASDIAADLSAFVELRSVQLSGLPLSKAHLDGLATLPRLKTLSLLNVQPLIGTEAADAEEANGDLRSLDELDLDAPDLDMASLARAPALEELHLFNGSRRSLAGLGRMPRLRTFRLWNLAPVEDVKAFSTLNPQCDVGYRVDASDGLRFSAEKKIDRFASGP